MTGSVNTGTENKDKLMDRAIELFEIWGDGDENDWANKLGFYLHIGTRNAKENYINQCLSVGILTHSGGMHIKFVSKNPTSTHKENDKPKLHDTRGSKSDV